MACKSLEPGAPFDWLLLCSVVLAVPILGSKFQYIISTIYDPYKRNILNPQTVLNISSTKVPNPNKEFPQSMIVVDTSKPKLLNPGTIYDPYKHAHNVWLFTNLDLQCACPCLLSTYPRLLWQSLFTTQLTSSPVPACLVWLVLSFLASILPSFLPPGSVQVCNSINWSIGVCHHDNRSSNLFFGTKITKRQLHIRVSHTLIW